MQSLMGETPKTALHRCLDAVVMGETPKTALHRCLDAVAHGGNPQDRAASLS